MPKYSFGQFGVDTPEVCDLSIPGMEILIDPRSDRAAVLRVVDELFLPLLRKSIEDVIDGRLRCGLPAAE